MGRDFFFFNRPATSDEDFKLDLFEDGNGNPRAMETKEGTPQGSA